MKKHLLMTGILACMLVFGTERVHAQTVNLDTAVNGAVDAVYEKLKIGSKLAVLNISSGSARMSDYIIEEMSSIFINQQLITVADRSQLVPIQKEMNLQSSSEVSGASAQAIGRRLGVQYVITGSFEPVADYYRFRVRVIDVQTAAILLTHSANVQNDKTVASLMGSNEANNPAPAPAPAVTTTPSNQSASSFLSMGVGGYFTADIGGGVKGEVTTTINQLPMGVGGSSTTTTIDIINPYIGGGAFIFLDATYLELSLGLFGANCFWDKKVSKPNSGSSIYERSSDNKREAFSALLAGADIGLMLKYPYAFNKEYSIFPLFGITYRAIFSAGDADKEVGEAAFLNALWFKLGGGFDYYFTDKAYMRMSLLYGIRLKNKYEDATISLYKAAGSTGTVKADLKSIIGHGPDIKFAVGRKF